MFSGFGVFTTKDFVKGEFLLDYAGNLMSQEDAMLIAVQTYVYYFQLGRMKYR
jgi:hypothetical protein